jgi:hypothetical protein
MGAVAIAAVLVARSFINQRDAIWQERVEREMARATANLKAVDRAQEEAVRFQAAADSLLSLSREKDTVVVTMIEELPAPPPDCEAFTAPRDSVIRYLRDQRLNVLAALDAQRKAAALLQNAADQAAETADSLYSVLDDRPRPVSPLIPKVGIGMVAGLCTTGQPCVAGGLSLQWEVNLF